MKDFLEVKFHQFGGPDVLKIEKRPLAELLDDEVLINQKAIGVNFIDSYYRSGLYQVPLPSGLGTEAAGVVESVGKKVTHLKVGDRVAYATGPVGAYAEMRNVPAQFVIRIPDEVTFSEAASVLLKGLTVHYLFKKIFPLKKGDKFLFHAAAGGVGLIACQWARSLGAELIGTVSSREKSLMAKNNGAWETIDYVQEDVVSRVKELTSNQKLPVVFDSVGQSTWEISLDCLRPKGLLVSFGNASGPVTGVNLATLAQKGSLFVTRPILSHYVETHEKLESAANEVWDLVKRGVIQAQAQETYSLKEAVKVHQELANRKRAGSIIFQN